MNRVEVANYALTMVGESPIRDFPPGEDTTNSRRVNALLKVLTKSLATTRDWKFLRKEATLAYLDEESELGERVYSLPGDCLKVIEVFPIGRADTWWIRGDRLICNLDEITVLYTSLEKIEGPYPDWFGMALATLLASRMAPLVNKQDISFTHTLNAQAREAEAKAGAIDANQGNRYKGTGDGTNEREDSFVTGTRPTQ